MLKNLTKQWYQRRVREVIMDGKIANRCVICLSGITNDLAVIPDCKHNYCYECIMGWASKQLFCPLCKVRFHSLHRYAVVGQDDYTVQYLSEPTRQVDNSVPDLACLSDKYFIGQASLFSLQIRNTVIWLAWVISKASFQVSMV
eukprot:TRINITY_DN1870_c0_g2_i9.p1 TRINITY_DN1870_c0_g2~~TRINITY_DN1870_c0_g2_i9.p1  ORF type:complete len:144 (-),score=22.90 TRINITY_DN1870_c0_g2_i9:279-710(-)